MKEELIAKRYGDAFMGYVRETIGAQRAIQELRNLKKIMFENPEFQDFLNNPGLTYAQKCEFVDRVLGEGFSKESKQFIKLILEKRRSGLLEDIVEYLRLTYSHGEAVDTLLRSSYPLDLDVVQSLKKVLEKKLKRPVRFYLEIAPDLLGGIQVHMGNIFIDGSLKRRFEDLRKKLKTLQVS